jgi:O-methyltransferase
VRVVARRVRLETRPFLGLGGQTTTLTPALSRGEREEEARPWSSELVMVGQSIDPRACKLQTAGDETVLYQIASRVAGWRGYELRPNGGATAPRAPQEPLDFTPDEIATLQAVRPHTMTSPERVISLIRAVEHITRQAIPGDLVECGVWRGGSMMAAAKTLLRLGDVSRTLHLFDTFEGMPPPTDVDRAAADGTLAADLLEAEANDRETSVNWAVAGLDLVRANVGSVGYPADRVNYVVGKVEDTIPRAAPERIALLRLDTDWYESTRHELIHLYPRLVPGGLLIVDDYGHWGGARRAVDEYLEEAKIPLFLSRIDYTGRIAVKV